MRVREPSLTDPGTLGAGAPFPGAFRSVRLHVAIAISPRRPGIAPEFPEPGKTWPPCVAAHPLAASGPSALHVRSDRI